MSTDGRAGYAPGVRSILRRYVAWERRWGIPVNGFMANVYEWMFVIIGPVALVVGALGLVWGFWVGAVALILGCGMTWVGWRRLIRFARLRP
jgi:hypothetical protein